MRALPHYFRLNDMALFRYLKRECAALPFPAKVLSLAWFHDRVDRQNKISSNALNIIPAPIFPAMRNNMHPPHVKVIIAHAVSMYYWRTGASQPSRTAGSRCRYNMSYVVGAR